MRLGSWVGVVREASVLSPSIRILLQFEHCVPFGNVGFPSIRLCLFVL